MNTSERECQEENAVMADEPGVLGWSAEEWERSTRKGEAAADLSSDERTELAELRAWSSRVLQVLS